MWKYAAVAYLHTLYWHLYLRITKSNPRQRRPSPGRDLKSDPLKREASILTTRLEK